MCQTRKRNYSAESNQLRYFFVYFVERMRNNPSCLCEFDYECSYYTRINYKTIIYVRFTYMTKVVQCFTLDLFLIQLIGMINIYIFLYNYLMYIFCIAKLLLDVYKTIPIGKPRITILYYYDPNYHNNNT